MKRINRIKKNSKLRNNEKNNYKIYNLLKIILLNFYSRKINNFLIYFYYLNNY